MNFILNGQGHGNVANVLMANNFDPRALRPFIGADDRAYQTRSTGKLDSNGEVITNDIVTNAPAVLRKDDWLMLDTAVIKAAKPRLNVIGDFRGAGLQLTIPNGMGKMTLEHETQSDITEATISMDGMRKSDGDRPEFSLESIPLPIIHKDFSFPARQVMASRNGGSPLDTTTAELAGRRVAEEAEKLMLGESSVTTIGGGSLYGLKNYPSRLTKSLTAPTSSNHPTTGAEVLAMRKQSTDAGYYGPWNLYYSPAWYASMDEDYSTTVNQSWTLRQRLMQIEGISNIRPADYLTGTTLLMVQQTPDVARVVVGMDITTVQWPSGDGMELNFKVMAIMVPQVRKDFYDATGIVHGSV